MGGKIIGYIRVSSLDQSTDRQLDGITLDKTYTDKLSGKTTDRPALQSLLDYVRDGDTVVVHSMDRLARNLDDLRNIVKKLTSKQVKVKFSVTIAKKIADLEVANRWLRREREIAFCGADDFDPVEGYNVDDGKRAFS